MTERRTTEEQEDIGRRIEVKIRRAIGELLGAEPTDDWDTIGKKVETKVRTELVASERMSRTSVAVRATPIVSLGRSP